MNIFVTRSDTSARTNNGQCVQTIVNHWLAPYTVVILSWFLAWWLQMGELRPLFNFAPGIELPFFPAGIRTFAVFAFGFPGAVALFIASLITYAFYFPELIGSTPITVAGCAAASAFSAYIAMRAICRFCEIPNTLSGLTFKSVIMIVITQSVLSAFVHHCFYYADGIETYSTSEAVFYWGAMATGDALGSMAVLFSVMFTYYLYKKYW